MRHPAPPEGYLLPRVATAMREDAKVIPAEMARRLCVTASAVTQYENPANPTTEPTLRAYAAALGLPFEQALLGALAKLGVGAQRAAVRHEVTPPEYHEDLLKPPTQAFAGGRWSETWKPGRAARRREDALRAALSDVRRAKGQDGGELGSVEVMAFSYVVPEGVTPPDLERRNQPKPARRLPPTVFV